MKKNCMSKKVVALVLLVAMTSSNVVYAKEGAKKEESVYVTISQKGEIKEKIVSDWIHSDDSNIEIKDKTDLKDIVNLKGEEKPEKNGDYLIWKSDKKDIFYQGKSDKNLPLKVEVKYTLDGKEIGGDELSGKSGDLTINVKIINEDSHKVNVKGKEKTIYTPFLSVATLNLSNDNFENVKVEGGTVVSDGNNQVVTFVTLPGMKESLDLKDNILDLELKEDLEIKAKVNNFKMSPIMVVATPKLPELKELKEAKTIDELKNGLNEIKDASSKLTEGSLKLADGGKELATNINKFKGGVDVLKFGVSDLFNGILKYTKAVGAAKEGSDQLNDGISKVGAGTDKFEDATGKLNEGAKVINSKTEELGSGIGSLADGTEQLKLGESQLTEGTKQLAENINKIKAGKEKELQAINMLVGGVDLLKGAIEPLKAMPGLDTLYNGLSEGLDKQRLGLEGISKSSKDLIDALEQLEAGANNIKAASEKLSGGLDNLQKGQVKAKEGAAQLAKGTKDYSEKINELSNETKKLNGGVKEVKSGSQKLNGGLTTLNENSISLVGGGKKLQEGSKTLSEGSILLNNGANKLYEGAKELSVNMKKFNDEGISKIYNEVSPKVQDLEEIMDTKDEIVKLSENYKAFTDLGENMEGTVKFIIKVDEIKEKEEKKVNKVEKVEEKKGFIQWLKNIF